MLYCTPKLPAQMVVVPVMAVDESGSMSTVTASCDELPVPHAFTPETATLPEPVALVKSQVTEFVPEPLVMTTPGGNVQL